MILQSSKAHQQAYLISKAYQRTFLSSMTDLFTATMRNLVAAMMRNLAAVMMRNLMVAVVIITLSGYQATTNAWYTHPNTSTMS